jgi:phosphoglycolate phosphatase
VTSGFRLIVFDLDGTLVDSLTDLAESANALLVECGGQPLPRESIGRMVGDGAATLVARAFASAVIPPPPDALARFLAIYDARLVKCTRPYPGVPETLDVLFSRATLAVLTNKPLGATRKILEGLELARFFDSGHVLGGDGTFPRKPDPAGLLHLMKNVGAAATDVALVGDSVIDWRTARAAGTAVCLARYGFGFDGFPVAELDGRERLVDEPMELLAVL